MPHTFQIFLISIFTLVAGRAAEAENFLNIASPPGDWPDALPLVTSTHAALVLDSPAQTRLRCFLPGAAGVVRASEAEMRTDVEAILDQPAPSTELIIDWQHPFGPPKEFARTSHLSALMVRSSHKSSDTTITRTVVASPQDGAVFIHLLADKPGALALRVTHRTPSQRVENRQQLIFTPENAGQLASHVWVLPFEADVTPEGQTIGLYGEGEALIVWNFAGPNQEKPPLSATLDRLAAKYDEGKSPPDPVRIWRGIFATLTKSAEKTP